MAAVVLALSAHPDDIEFLMAGTLALLARSGCTVHYLTLANGSCDPRVWMLRRSPQ
jgi:LmbE family N-acetylglucosaminyl deacetylase